MIVKILTLASVDPPASLRLVREFETELQDMPLFCGGDCPVEALPLDLVSNYWLAAHLLGEEFKISGDWQLRCAVFVRVCVVPSHC